MKIFFLDVYSDEELTTSEHYKEVIQPMRNWSDQFIYNLKKNVEFIDSDYIERNKYKRINRVKAGTYTGKNGNIKAMFSSFDLSGVEIIIDIPVKKSLNCEC